MELTGAILIYCGGTKALAQPIGLGWFKCQKCLRPIQGDRGRMSGKMFDTDESARHGCADIDQDAEGWDFITCDCGEALGVFPDRVTAVDALIDHVIMRGLKAAR